MIKSEEYVFRRARKLYKAMELGRNEKQDTSMRQRKRKNVEELAFTHLSLLNNDYCNSKL